MGMGGGRQLTLEALEVLERSDIVFGASRMLADLAPWISEKHQETYYQPEKILDWLEKIEPVSMPWWFAPGIPDSTAEAAA